MSFTRCDACSINYRKKRRYAIKKKQRAKKIYTRITYTGARRYNYYNTVYYTRGAVHFRISFSRSRMPCSRRPYSPLRRGKRNRFVIRTHAAKVVPSIFNYGPSGANDLNVLIILSRRFA